MNKILSKEQLSEKIFRFEIDAPEIAVSRKAGNFIIFRLDEKGERIPLTIVDSDVARGSISLIIQNVGVSSAKMCALNAGDFLVDLVGPLGKATHIHKAGTILAMGGGVGIAPLFPIVKAFKEAGNKVITIIAGRSKELLILEDDVKKYSDELIVMTDDGSYGRKGLITEGAEEVLKREKIDECIAIGPAVMMKYAALTTKKYNVPTQASLNAIMVDGTGMCGACRVTVGGTTMFTCVDGPEFDAHQIDFDGLMMRLNAYKSLENKSFDKYEHSKTCKCHE